MELEAEKCIQSKQHIYTQYTTPLKAWCHVMIFSLCWKRISRFGQGQGIDHALAFGIFETKCAEVTSNQILRSTFCAKQHRVRIQWFSLPHRKVYGTVLEMYSCHFQSCKVVCCMMGLSWDGSEHDPLTRVFTERWMENTMGTTALELGM